MSPTLAIPKWLDTESMAAALGIHPKTLLLLRRHSHNPFSEGTHFRRRGISTRAPYQWRPDLTEAAFTRFRRIDPSRVDVFSEAESR
jgi:hypothetical protein